MLSTTHDSVNEWLTQLNQNSTDKTIWNINEVVIPLSIQKTYNYTNCDIQMRYFPQPSNKTDTFETAAQISYNSKDGKALVEIYYLQIEKKLVPSENYGYSSVESYSDNPVEYFRLKQAISHEIGHFMGLGHYHEGNEKIMQRWSQGLEKPPSIMVEVQGLNAQYYSVTQNDGEQVKLKYGNGGFGGNTTSGLRHEMVDLSKQELSIVPPTSTEPSYCLKDKSVASDSHSLLTKEDINTGTTVLFTYSPNKLYNGCKNSWTFEFVNEKNQQDHLSNVYYNIFIQQDVMRSVAEEEEKQYFFTSNGTASNDIQVKEKVGVINYWIVTFEKPPDKYDRGTIKDSALLFLKVSPPTISKTLIQQEISPWVKTTAHLWSMSEVPNSEFIQIIQYLDEQGMIKMNKTGSEVTKQVPMWLKKSSAFWTNGQTSDKEFLQGIQFLIDHKIIKL